MTRITAVPESQALHPQQKPAKTSAGGFSETLSRAMETEKPSSTAAGSLGEIQACGFQPIETPTETLVRRTDSLLNLMDTYAQDLSDPSKSLKEISPALDTINQHATELLEQSKTLSPKDDALTGIASQVALTARMEVIKFQRGDYV
jgi:uncharacterized protein YoxC